MIVCNFVDLHCFIQNMENAISNLSFYSEPTIKDRCEWVLDDIIMNIAMKEVIKNHMCEEIITDIIAKVTEKKPIKINRVVNNCCYRWNSKW